MTATLSETALARASLTSIIPEAELLQGLSRRRPWITQFLIDGRPVGGEYPAYADAAIDQFFESFPDARSVLELGSLEGSHTFALARHPGDRHVLAVEGREYNVEKARFVQRATGVHNVQFVRGDLEELDLTAFGRFEAIFCSGLLYHLPEPWKLVKRLSELSDNLFIRTHYALESNVNMLANGFPGYKFPESGYNDPCSGLSPSSFWPTLEGLQHLLAVNGFPFVTILEDFQHRGGRMVALAARR